MAISISVEAAQLLEHFQWKTDEQVSEALRDETKLSEVTNEFADVIIYCLGLTDVLRVYLSEAVEKNLERIVRSIPQLTHSRQGNRPG